MSLRRVLFPAAATVALTLAAGTPAWAAFPGRNGVIVYTQASLDPSGYDNGRPGAAPSDLRSIAPDGTGDRALTETPASESVPVPSPDGQRLAYVRDGRLWLSKIDGTDARRLPRTGGESDLPTWGRDGHRLLWFGGEGDIRSIDLGATYTPVGPSSTVIPSELDRSKGTASLAALPLLSADGRTLVYTRLTIGSGHTFAGHVSTWAANPDGTGRHQLINGTGDYRETVGADISPDSRRLVFGGTNSSKKSAMRRIFVADIDGRGTRVLATAPAGHSEYTGFAWSPDGTSVVAARNEVDVEHGAVLEVIDVATGATRTVKRITTGTIEDPRWQSLRAG